MEVHPVTFAGGVTIHGQVALPDRDGRVPGLVLIGGSGPSDRHNGGMFDAISGALAARGIAVLSYDKRGAGASGGEWESADVEQLATDARAAVAALGAQARCDEASIGVLGHSEGGWVAMRLCAQTDSPQHAILNSSPAVPFLDSEVFALTAAGVPAADAGRVAARLRQLTRAARGGRGPAEFPELVAEVEAEPWYEVVRASGFELSRSTWRQLAAWGDHDPAGDLSQIHVPTLVVLGADDPLVPVQASLAAYEHTADRTGRKQAVQVYPGAGHRLLRASGELAGGYLEALADWCLERHRDR